MLATNVFKIEISFFVRLWSLTWMNIHGARLCEENVRVLYRELGEKHFSKCQAKGTGNSQNFCTFISSLLTNIWDEFLLFPDNIIRYSTSTSTRKVLWNFEVLEFAEERNRCGKRIRDRIRWYHPNFILFSSVSNS